jgi:hypothetical protein
VQAIFDYGGGTFQQPGKAQASVLLGGDDLMAALLAVGGFGRVAAPEVVAAGGQINLGVLGEPCFQGCGTGQGLVDCGGGGSDCDLEPVKFVHRVPPLLSEIGDVTH